MCRYLGMDHTLTLADAETSPIAPDQGPTLRLVGDVELKMCPQCFGQGWVPCPATVATRTLGLNGVPALQPGTGHPIPCPSCAGKKQITNVG